MHASFYVFGVIAVAAVLMMSNRVRYDFVALIVVLALVLGDTLTVAQALSGFGSSVVILVACLFVVGEMLDRTGVARSVGNLILQHGGGNETRLLVLLMVSSGLLGCFMSSTAVVAIFIPIVLRIAADTGLDKSRLLLPMSYAALISGMLTLIATTPNLVVSDELVAQGYDALGFFSFFLIGALILIVTIFYILFWGRGLLGSKAPKGATIARRTHAKRTLADLRQTFAIKGEINDFWIERPVPLAAIRQLATDGVVFVARRRRGKNQLLETVLFRDGMELQRNDLVLLRGPKEVLEKLANRAEFKRRSDAGIRPQDWTDALGMADVMVHPEASIIGEYASIALASDEGAIDVLGLLRAGEPVPFQDVQKTKLKSGDRMLVVGPWRELDSLVEQNDDFVLLSYPQERDATVPMLPRYWIAIAILTGMVVLSVFDIVPVTIAVLLAAIAAVVFRTMPADHAFKTVNLSTIVLIAGMLPLADALDQTGGTKLIVTALLDLLGQADPEVMMAALFLMTALLGLVLSNTASAVLVAPIAITAAEAMQVSPYPFAIGVLIAASSAFSTPVSTPVVTLVVTPGGYSFSDFLKLGFPLTLIVCVVTIFATPLIFPY